ncbi:MAG: glycosyltransferase family 39 protein [Candidatus Avispirillum sp.]
MKKRQIGRNSAENIIRTVLLSFTLLFFGAFILLSLKSFIEGPYSSYLLNIKPVRMICAVYSLIFLILLALYCSDNIRACLRKMKVWQLAGAVFIAALVPRVIVACIGTSTPVSDFGYYYNMMKLFYGEEGHALAKAAMEHYGYYGYYGLGLIHGIIGRIAGEGLYSAQLAFSVITSASAVLIFFIGSRFSRPAGMAAGLLFAFYPSNIFMAQITNNQHCAIFFALLALYFLIIARDAKHFYGIILLGASGGAAMLLSHYCHPSSTSTRIAAAAYFVVLILSCLRSKKQLLGAVCLAVCFFASFAVFDKISYTVMDGTGFLDKANQSESDGEDSNDSEPLYISKIAVGLNPESRGRYNEEVYGIGNSLSREEAEREYKEMIASYFEEPEELIRTLILKTQFMWGGCDSSFMFYKLDMENKVADDTGAGTLGVSSQQFYPNYLNYIKAMSFADAVYTFFMYVFAAIGAVCFVRKRFAGFDLLMWTLLGWIGVHVLIEVQPRYRYYAMTIIAVFAGVGISVAAKQVHSAAAAVVKRFSTDGKAGEECS